MKVLIVATGELDDRKTLCAVRSLGRAGFDVTIASDSFRGRSFHSRFGKKRVRLPQAEIDGVAFVEALKRVAGKGGYDVLLPTTDRTTVLLSRHQAEFENLASMAVPSVEAGELCKDKFRLARFAGEIGIPVPGTFRLEDEAALDARLRGLSFPVMVKPRKGAGGVGAHIVHGKDELLRVFRELPRERDDVFDFSAPLLQQFVDGDVHEVNALCDHGELRVAMTQKRLLRYPRCGAGIYNMSTDEPDLVETAERLLRALEWNGPAQVEFLRDRDSGRFWLLEVNGRFWGTMDLAVATGLDFPVLACRLALGERIPDRPAYRVGLRYRWPFPYALLHAMETGRWWGAFRDFVLPRRATRSDISFSDPIPLLMELAYTFDRYRKQGFRRLDTKGKIHRNDD